MPQMAPLSWLLLFIYFSILLLLFNSINYYNFTYNIKNYNINKTLISNNWVW